MERWGWSQPHHSLGFRGAPVARHGFTEPFWGNCRELGVCGGGRAERTKLGGPGGASAKIAAAFAPARVEVGSCGGRSRH